MNDKIHANVNIAILHYYYIHFSEFSTKQIEELIEATMKTWYMVYDMYTRYGVDENGYFEVYTCNMDLRNICVVIDKYPYYYQTFIDVLCNNSILIQNPKNHITSSRENKSYKINIDFEDVPFPINS